MDVEDLAAHAIYAGGYHQDHPIIANLWQVACRTASLVHQFFDSCQGQVRIAK